MYSDNGKISARQMQILLILDVLGISIIVLPKYNSSLLGFDGILLPVAGGVLALISLFFICRLAPFLGEFGFFDGLSRLIGRFMSGLVSLGLVFKLIFSLGCGIRIFSEAAKLKFLPNTPLWIISGLILLPCLYGAFKGYESRARLGELLVFIILIPFLIVFVPRIMECSFPSVIPNINISKDIYFKGSLTNCFAFTGMEFLLLTFNHLNNMSDIGKKLASAFIFALVLVFLVNFVTISILGDTLAASFDFPAVDIMDISSVSKGKGGIMMSIFYLSVVIYEIGAIYLGSGLFGDILGKRRSIYMYMAAFGGYALSLGFNDINSVIVCFTKINMFFGIAYFFVLPIFMNIIIKLKKDDVYA